MTTTIVTWVLFVYVYWPGMGGVRSETEMPSMETCFAALREVRFNETHGDENEWVVAAWCHTNVTPTKEKP